MMYSRYSSSRKYWCVFERCGGAFDKLLEYGLVDEREADLMIKLIKEDRSERGMKNEI